MLKQQQKAIARVLVTVGVGEYEHVFWILSQVGRYGERLQGKPYELVYQSIIINRKLARTANYFAVTIKSISKRYANCGGSGECW